METVRPNLPPRTPESQSSRTVIHSDSRVLQMTGLYLEVGYLAKIALRQARKISDSRFRISP